MTNVRLTISAETDIAQAYHWYETKREGLGLEFLERVDEAIGQIAANPRAYRKLIDDARRVLLREFPYGMWYTVEEDGSLVIACLHHKRDARLARERVKGIIVMPKRPDPRKG